MTVKNIGKKGVFTGAIALAMIAGAVGGQVVKPGQSSAQTATTTPAVTTTPATTNNSGGTVNNTAPNGGTVQSNENPTHEAQESAQWEAAENAGKQPWTNPSAYGGNPHTQSSGSTSQ